MFPCHHFKLVKFTQIHGKKKKKKLTAQEGIEMKSLRPFLDFHCREFSIYLVQKLGFSNLAEWSTSVVPLGGGRALKL